ncbi:MAG: flagellar basal body P-ring protein FlgI [Candidatus Schekmanbacteria bacterium]|nr:MAG: flagellar basal body P-ring protein FlgI [Candidatus Schekmanbacteria bacterium]
MKLFRGIFIFLFILLFLSLNSANAVKIRDLAYIEGLRGNKLIGYGLVVGLNGTGDKQGTEFTIQSLTNMLRKNGILVSPDDVKVKNVAAVMVTADLPPFPRKGMRIDVLVSSIGDATSLQGGTLLLTPLKGADGKIYAVAQGPLSIGGFSAGGAGGEKVQKNHLNAGKIPDGAIIEREIPYNFSNTSRITFSLRNSDFTTTNKVAEKINSFIGNSIAFPMDAVNVTVDIPDEYRNNPVRFVSLIENLDVTPEIPAKIVIDERTGTVVVGENVRISTLAISHGNLTIEINSKFKISQPSPFSKKGETVVVPETKTSIKEEKGHLILVEGGVSIKELVRALNAIGVTTRDLITIFQAIKAAGALHAELEII